MKKRGWRLFATSGSVLALWAAVGIGQQRSTGPGDQARPQPPGQRPAGGERVPGPSIQLQVPPMPVLPNKGLGETDQELIPGQRWRIRDLNRPRPAAAAPARHAGDPPSDALVLFNGADLSHWTVGGPGRGAPGGQAPSTPAPATWKVENGYVELTPAAGSLTSKERFKDFQLHLEFAEPAIPLGESQYRGNSGVIVGGREIQILDNYNNPTYADGYVAAIYNAWPPLANASRPPGEWQTLDVAYMAPRYDGATLVRGAYYTVFLNGIMVHDNREVSPSSRGGFPPAAPAGAAGSAARGPAAPPSADQPIVLMGHPSAIPGNAVRYRNIWVRTVEVEMPQPPAGQR